jgi:hypothetical protein
MSAFRKINRDLRREFGVAPGDALQRAHWRLAMTTGQIETRIGAVMRDTNGDGTGIYLGTDTGVHKLPKYNYGNYATIPHYALERFLFLALPLGEVPESEKGGYEAVHIFPLIDGKAAMPPYRALQMVINCLLYGPKKTLSEWEGEDKEKMEREIKLFQDVLEDESPWLAGQIGRGEAVGQAGVEESPLLKQIREAPTTTLTIPGEK